MLMLCYIVFFYIKRILYVSIYMFINIFDLCEVLEIMNDINRWRIIPALLQLSQNSDKFLVRMSQLVDNNNNTVTFVKNKILKQVFCRFSINQYLIYIGFRK